LFKIRKKLNASNKNKGLGRSLPSLSGDSRIHSSNNNNAMMMMMGVENSISREECKSSGRSFEGSHFISSE
jgi:hypothetical protein